MIDAKEYNAFAALPDNNGAEQAHHIIIHGDTASDDEHATLNVNIPVSALEQARKGGTQQRATIGFRLTVDFELEGKPYELHANWVALRRRKR